MMQEHQKEWLDLDISLSLVVSPPHHKTLGCEVGWRKYQITDISQCWFL
jgi:hypothetical protein